MRIKGILMSGKGKANLRFQVVPWISKPVFISNLSTRDTYGELGFQIYTAEWLQAKGDEWWHHSAGENRGSGIYGLRAGLMAKRSGQSKGFPDWVHPGRRLALELKLPKGSVSPDQLRWLTYFKSIGWWAEVVRSFERFEEIYYSKADL